MIDYWYTQYNEIESKVAILESLFEFNLKQTCCRNTVIIQVYFLILKQLISLYKVDKEISILYGKQAIELLDKLEYKASGILLLKILCTLMIFRAKKDEVKQEDVYKLRQQFIWFVTHIDSIGGNYSILNMITILFTYQILL